MKKILPNKLGDLVQKKRIEKNLTQEQLGNLTNINPLIIERIELKKLIPSLAQLNKLLEVLNIDFESIVNKDVNEELISDADDLTKTKEEIRERCTYRRLIKIFNTAATNEETKGIEKMITMMLCLRKHYILRSKLNVK